MIQTMSEGSAVVQGEENDIRKPSFEGELSGGVASEQATRPRTKSPSTELKLGPKK